MAISNVSVFSEKHDRRSIIRYGLVPAKTAMYINRLLLSVVARFGRNSCSCTAVCSLWWRRMDAVPALSGRHERPGRRQWQPWSAAQPACQPALKGSTETRDQFHRAQQGARQAERMEKANSRNGVFPEGEDPAAAGSGGGQPEHGARATERADRRATQGMCRPYTV